MREGNPAGAEDQVDPAVRINRADDAGREPRVGLGPVDLAIERDAVLVTRPGLEPAHADERVVMTLDAKGARAVVEHLHLAGVVGLDPDDRLRVGDVSKQGA